MRRMGIDEDDAVGCRRHDPFTVHLPERAQRCEALQCGSRHDVAIRGRRRARFAQRCRGALATRGGISEAEALRAGCELGALEGEACGVDAA